SDRRSPSGDSSATRRKSSARPDSARGQAPLSFCMQAIFLYEQQVQPEHETMFKCLQMLQTQLGISMLTIRSLSVPHPLSDALPRELPVSLLDCSADTWPRHLRASISMWSSASFFPAISFAIFR